MHVNVFLLLGSILFILPALAFCYAHLLSNSLSNLLAWVTSLSQFGVFIFAVYVFKKEKKRREDIKLYDLFSNLKETEKYIKAWSRLLSEYRVGVYTRIDIEEIRKLYISHGDFIEKYNCEHKKIERTLGLFLVRFKCYIHFYDVKTIRDACMFAEFLNNLKESMQRYITVHNRNKKSYKYRNKSTAENSKADNLATERKWKEAIENIAEFERITEKIKNIMKTVNCGLPEELQSPTSSKLCENTITLHLKF